MKTETVPRCQQLFFGVLKHCPGVQVAAHILDDAITGDLRKKILSPDSLILIWKEMRSQALQMRSKATLERSSRLAARAELASRIERLYESVETGAFGAVVGGPPHPGLVIQ
jgi:hypothetical protein